MKRISRELYWFWQLTYPFWERYLVLKILKYYYKKLRSIKQYCIIVDLGCGKGHFEEYLRRKDYKLYDLTYIVGIDIYLPYLRVAKDLFDDVILADLQYLPLREKAINVILLLDVIEHLTKHNAIKLFNIIDKLIVSNGIIIVSTPYGFTPQDEFDGNPFQRHLSEWYPEELIAVGFKPITGIGGFRDWRKRISFLSKKYILWKIAELIIQSITNPMCFKDYTKGFRVLYLKRIR